MATATFKTHGFTWTSNHDKKESWRLSLKDLTIYIENSNVYRSGWVLNCKELGLSYIELSASTKEQAAEEAIELCRKRIKDFSSVLSVNK